MEIIYCAAVIGRIPDVRQTLFRQSVEWDSFTGCRAEPGELSFQTRHGKIGKGADFWNLKTTLRRNQVDRKRRVLVAGQQNAQRAVLDLIGNMI